MAISQKLASFDPNNAEWQVDLAISIWNVYFVTFTTAIDERRRLLWQGLDVLRALESAGKLPFRARALSETFNRAIADLR